MQLNPNSGSWVPLQGLPSLNEPLIPLTIIDNINEVELEDNNCIFVTKLPPYTTRENIIDFFSKYGSIHKIDSWNIHKHFCHVYMKSVADANKIVNMKNFDFLGTYQWSYGTTRGSVPYQYPQITNPVSKYPQFP